MTRKTAWMLAGLVAVGLSWTGGSLDRAAVPATAGSKSDVVLVRCATGGARLVVSAYEGSTAAPSKRVENCAETLSLLLKEGFEIRHVGESHVDPEHLVYTLVR